MLGWATDDLVELDLLAPGLIGKVLVASPQRRQAIFSVLAHRKLIEQGTAFPPFPDFTDAALAKVLMRERPSRILSFVFGEVHDGWLGALERLGQAPLDSPRPYQTLRAVFAPGGNPKRVAALSRVGEITEAMLLMIDEIDPRWIHPHTLQKIDTRQGAKIFNQAVAFAQSVNSSASDELIWTIISSLKPTSELNLAIDRLVRRADRFPDQPLLATADLRPLASPRDIIGAGRRYRNCLSTKLGEVLAGRLAFAEFRGSAIIEMRPLTGAGGWIVWEVHGPRNRGIAPDIESAATEAALMQGVPSVANDPGDPAWQGYRRYVGGGGFFVRMG